MVAKGTGHRITRHHQGPAPEEALQLILETARMTGLLSAPCFRRPGSPGNGKDSGGLLSAPREPAAVPAALHGVTRGVASVHFTGAETN